MKRLSAVLPTALAAILSLSACDTIDKVFEPQPKNLAADPAAVVPGDFLLTRYGPLNHWLDTAVRVQIHAVPLLDVFRHPALRGLQYQIMKMPPDNPPVTIDKLAMTRRQLLWAVAQDHQLQMTPRFNDSGELSCIEIRSRSEDLPKTKE